MAQAVVEGVRPMTNSCAICTDPARYCNSGALANPISVIESLKITCSIYTSTGFLAVLTLS